MKQSKRYTENLDKIDSNKEYGLDEAAAFLVDFSKTKFDESPVNNVPILSSK